MWADSSVTKRHSVSGTLAPSRCSAVWKILRSGFSVPAWVESVTRFFTGSKKGRSPVWSRIARYSSKIALILAAVTGGDDARKSETRHERNGVPPVVVKLDMAVRASFTWANGLLV